MIYVNYKKNKIIITCIIVKFINKIAKFFGLRGINNFIIRKSKKFDVYFYNQTYADVKINNIDPIDHYLSTGESLGNFPNKIFDPIIYKLKYPDLKNWKESLFIHFILIGDHQGRSAVPAEINYLLKRRKVNHEMLHHHIDQTNEDFLLNLNIRNKSIEISKKLIVNTPSPNFYINLLKKNIPFALNKRTHGFWDALVYIEYVTKDFEKIYSSILNKNQILTLACRWMREQPQRYQRFVYIFGEGFIRECFNDFNYPNNSKNLFQAISIVGTFGQKIPDSNKLHKEKMIEIICNLTKKFNKIYDATIWKEAAYTGELLNLVKTIQDRPIIAIGPNHLKKLNERIELKNFKFVEIPNHGGAIKKRLDVFQDLNNAIKEIISINKNSHPIIILQAGCIANWLIERLFNDHKNISYLDMGLVLDVWFPEIITTKSASWGWFGQRRYLILKKMKVEKLYRKILADKFYDYFPDLK